MHLQMSWPTPAMDVRTGGLDKMAMANEMDVPTSVQVPSSFSSPFASVAHNRPPLGHSKVRAKAVDISHSNAAHVNAIQWQIVVFRGDCRGTLRSFAIMVCMNWREGLRSPIAIRSRKSRFGPPFPPTSQSKSYTAQISRNTCWKNIEAQPDDGLLLTLTSMSQPRWRRRETLAWQQGMRRLANSSCLVSCG